jgi:hypothetical protein
MWVQVGLVHICTFILLKLSGERNFCVQLNKPFETTLPCYEFPLFTGTHSDLLVLVCITYIPTFIYIYMLCIIIFFFSVCLSV